MVTMRGSSLVLLAAAAAAPASLFSDPVSMHFGGEALPPARAQPAPKAPRDAVVPPPPSLSAPGSEFNLARPFQQAFPPGFGQPVVATRT